jgi:hypothetical protein
MESSGPRKRTLHIAAFPDELKHIIFSKLEFKEKLNAGLVCKEWDNLLRTCTGAARHWDIKYLVKRTVATTDSSKKYSAPYHLSASVARWAHQAYSLSHTKGYKNAITMTSRQC